MDCNKDEACRAKEIAEKKFTAKDIFGAKKFALKAQNLFPGLEGIPQLLATLDVYVSAENKINGEADWYGILGVDPLADDETVRKQYRKLALLLHPDKNKSMGADGAFKLVSEAWSLLSDKAKRVAYDCRRNAKVLNASTAVKRPPAPPAGANGAVNSTKTTSGAKAQKSTSRAANSSTPSTAHKSKTNTFWTVCHKCRMQYEYLRMYLNLKLLCPNCHEPFVAVETAPPSIKHFKKSTPWNFSQQHEKSNHRVHSKNISNAGKNDATTSNCEVESFSTTGSYNQTNCQWTPFSRTSGVPSAAQAATVVQQAYEKVKREREEAQAASKKREVLRRKQHVSKKMSGASSSGNFNSAKRRRGVEDAGLRGKNDSSQMGGGTGVAGPANRSNQDNHETGTVNWITKTRGARDISQLDVRNLLMEKARKEIYWKLNELKSSTPAKIAENKIGNVYKTETENLENSLKNSGTHNKIKRGTSEATMDESCGIKSSLSSTGPNKNAETLETMSVDVPDPDFYDFDKDRTERSFGENQIWAAYDDDDGMPRYYAMVHSVVSLNPFKIRISWLNSKTSSELGLLNWVGSGFSKTCGDFRIGRYEINSSLNSFSHKVRWRKGTHGIISIYPRRGDVWALYKNWSLEWNELTEDEVIHKYVMVEVLEDYNENFGVTIIPLVKVAGFKTVFHHHLDPKEVRTIRKEEMFCFSHQVPSYLLTGQEASNAPKGCHELDPAATPLDLLHIIRDDIEEDEAELELVKKQIAEANVPKADGSEMIDNTRKLQEERAVNHKNIEEVDSMHEPEERC